MRSSSGHRRSPGPRPPRPTLSQEDDTSLYQIGFQYRRSRRITLALRIILKACAGGTNAKIARQERISISTVRRWRARFIAEGPGALLPHRFLRPSRRIADARLKEVHRIIALGNLSTRAIARHVGVSQATVMRVKKGRLPSEPP